MVDLSRRALGKAAALLLVRGGSPALAPVTSAAGAAATAATAMGALPPAAIAAAKIMGAKEIRPLFYFATHQTFLFNPQIGLLAPNAPLSVFRPEGFPDFHEHRFTYSEMALDQLENAERLREAVDGLAAAGATFEEFTPQSLAILRASNPDLFRQIKNDDELFANIKIFIEAGCKDWRDARNFIRDRCLPVLDNLFQTSEVFSPRNIKLMERISTHLGGGTPYNDPFIKRFYTFKEVNARRRNDQARLERQQAARAKQLDQQAQKLCRPYHVEFLPPRRGSPASFFRIIPLSGNALDRSDIHRLARTLTPPPRRMAYSRPPTNPFEIRATPGIPGLTISTTNPYLIQFLSACAHGKEKFPPRPATPSPPLAEPAP